MKKSSNLAKILEIARVLEEIREARNSYKTNKKIEDEVRKELQRKDKVFRGLRRVYRAGVAFIEPETLLEMIRLGIYDKNKYNAPAIEWDVKHRYGPAIFYIRVRYEGKTYETQV